MDALTFLTFEDVIAAGACELGTIASCKRANVFFASVDDALSVFKGHEDRILRAANLDGYGYGNGDGDGDGDGDGYGYGYGDGGF